MTAAPYVAFGTVWFGYFAAIGAFNPYAPLWFKDLGYSTLAIGALSSLQAWARVAAPYAWGWLADHRGRRVPLIRWAAAGSLLAAACLLAVRDYTLMSVVVAVLFIANGGVVPLSEAALGRHLSRGGTMDSARYGRVRMWGSIGFIASVMAFGGVLEWAGIGWFPALVVLMYALLVGAVLRLPVDAVDRHGHERPPPVWSVMRRPEVAWFFASCFFTVLAHTALYAFFSLYLDDQGFGKSTVGLLWGVAVAVEIAFFWAQGRVFERLTPHRWLEWAGALSVLRFGITAALGGSLLALTLAQSLHVVTFAAQHMACIVLINRHFPGALRGRGQALYTVIGYGASGVIGGVGGGWLSTQLGFAAVFWAAAVAAALGWACAARSRRCAGVVAATSER